MYDIIVIGSGPAGLTAALYARRAEKSVLLIEKAAFGGQMTHSPKIENYPGYSEISGSELADKLLSQVMEQGADIELDEVSAIEGVGGSFKVVCKNASFEAKSVIIAAGSKHRTLGLVDEELYTGEGISYCAVCDGAFYKGKTVAIIGGGNSALVEAGMLADGCEKVFIIQNLDYLTGEKNLATRLSKRDNVEILLSTVVDSIIAENNIFRGIKIKNQKTGELGELLIDGMFVAIGQKPENAPFSSVLKINEYGYIQSGEDCKPEGAPDGIFVAGDCRTKAIRQITTATADGAVAALAACRFIDELNG